MFHVKHFADSVVVEKRVVRIEQKNGAALVGNGGHKTSVFFIMPEVTPERAGDHGTALSPPVV
jgi:hypothetical protein